MRSPLLALLILLVPMIASGQPPRVDPFAGLLPKGAKVEAAPTVPSLEQLRMATLAVVASQNLEATVKDHVDYFERGGKERQKAIFGTIAAAAGAFSALAMPAAGLQTGADAAAQGAQGARMARDPRNFTDRLVAALVPYFKSVVPANDIADALDKHADYVAIVDYWIHIDGFSAMFHSKGGLYVLDPTLRSVVVAEGSSDHKMENSGAFDSIAQIMAGTERAYVKGMDVPFAQISQALTQKVGSPLPVAPPRGVPTALPMPAAQAMPAQGAPAGALPPLERLRALDEALKQGLITSEEAAKKREEILKAM